MVVPSMMLESVLLELPSAKFRAGMHSISKDLIDFVIVISCAVVSCTNRRSRCLSSGYNHIVDSCGIIIIMSVSGDLTVYSF